MKKYATPFVISEMKKQQYMFNETIYSELFQLQHQSHMLIFWNVLESSERCLVYCEPENWLLPILICWLLGSNVLSIFILTW